MPEIFTPHWWSAIAAIVVIDLVLAGDNALVIGLAARDVPIPLQRRVVLWGTAGAIVVRLLLTFAVVWLMRIPGFLLIGGIALVWIGWKLTHGGSAHRDVKSARTVGSAIRTIVVADAVMGVDNVLAVGGAAHGDFLLVVIGLAISVPIVVWGSKLVLKLVDRHPSIVWVGAGVVGWTAAKMIASEPMIEPWLAARPLVRTGLVALIVAGLVTLPVWRSLTTEQRAQGAVLALMVVWVSALGWVEDYAGTPFNLFDQWRWDDELIDLVRWVGWIPLAIPLHRALAARAT